MPLRPEGKADDGQARHRAGGSVAEAAEAAGVSERTCCKWAAASAQMASQVLLDRSSAPRRVPSRTSEAGVEAIAALRRGPDDRPEIAECLGMARSTVSTVLARIGLGRPSRLEPLEPIRRYEKQYSGELVHIGTSRSW